MKLSSEDLYLREDRCLLEGRVWDARYKKSPILQGGLGNPNNCGGENARGFVGGVRQNERIHIGLLQGVRKYKKIESPILDEGAVCQRRFERLWNG